MENPLLIVKNLGQIIIGKKIKEIFFNTILGSLHRNYFYDIKSNKKQLTSSSLRQ